MSKNLYAIRKGSIFVILFYFLLPLQSASAALWEYSISGDVYIWEDGNLDSLEITGTAFIDDYKTPHIERDDGSDKCSTPGFEVCTVRFEITYFEMFMGSEYSFTGTSGHQQYDPADIEGVLYGTGDFSSLRWTRDASGSIYTAESYQEWLAFELPTSFGFDGTSEVLEVTNPDFPENGLIGGTFQRVGPVVPAPAAVWLFGSGLIGLIGIARRKKA